MKLGNPTTKPPSQRHLVLYLGPCRAERVLRAARHRAQYRAVEFTGEGKVSDVHKFTLADGRVVDFQSRETPSRGRTLTIIQQFFNACREISAAGIGSAVAGRSERAGSGPGAPRKSAV